MNKYEFLVKYKFESTYINKKTFYLNFNNFLPALIQNYDRRQIKFVSSTLKQL